MSEIVFPSTKAGNEVDRAVTAALQTIPGQVTQLDTRVTALENDVDDLQTLPAQLATIGSKLGEIITQSATGASSSIRAKVDVSLSAGATISYRYVADSTDFNITIRFHYTDNTTENIYFGSTTLKEGSATCSKATDYIEAVRYASEAVDGHTISLTIKTGINAAVDDLDGRVTKNESDISTLGTNMGGLSNLSTTDKASIVNAINEVVKLFDSKADVTDLSSIETAVSNLDMQINGTNGISNDFSFTIVPWQSSADVNIMYEGDVPSSSVISITINRTFETDLDVRTKNINSTYVSIGTITAGNTTATITSSIAGTNLRLFSGTSVSGTVTGTVGISHSSLTEAGLVDEVAENKREISLLKLDKGITGSSVVDTSSSFSVILNVELSSGDTFKANIDGVDTSKSLVVRTFGSNGEIAEELGYQTIGTTKSYSITQSAVRVAFLLYDTSSLTDGSVIRCTIFSEIFEKFENFDLEINGKPYIRTSSFDVDVVGWQANNRVNVIFDNDVPSGSRINVSIESALAVDLEIRALQSGGTWYKTLGTITAGNTSATMSTLVTTESYGGIKFYATSNVGNVKGQISIENEEYGHSSLGQRIDRIYSRMEEFYLKPCVSLVADDFYYSNNDYSGLGVTTKQQHDALHDALVSAGLTCDIGASWNQLQYIQNGNPLDVIGTATQWERDGFQFIFHPIHLNWFDGGTETKNLVEARKQLLDDIVASRTHLACRQRVFLYPGNSGGDADARAIVREFFDCGISWDNAGYYCVPEEGDDRFHIKRFNMQIGSKGLLTMAQMKSAIDEAAAKKAWIILGMHPHWLDLNGTSEDAEKFTIANMMEIINYALTATGTTKLVHVEEEWERRKPYFDFMGV